MNIVYTAIFNEYDNPQKVRPHEGWKFICFTDQDIAAPNWEVIKVENTPKIFRHIKICPHHFLPEHEKSIWMDGNIQMRFSPEWHIIEKTGVWLMKHPERQCIYEEAKCCVRLRKDKPETIDAQIEEYRRKQYPQNNGLVATGVIFRDNDVKIQPIMEAWWQEVRLNSVRDQLSFNYIAWKYKLEFQMFPFLHGFTWHAHEKRIRC